MRNTKKCVRPLAGAGIEIFPVPVQKWLRRVRPLAGAGIEILKMAEAEKNPAVRPLAGAGIEMRLPDERLRAVLRSPPRGGGN